MTDLASGPLRAYYELGQAAAQCGEPLDACRYRRPDRVNAWVRGWHAGEIERLRLEAFLAERLNKRVNEPSPEARGNGPSVAQ